MSNQNLTLYDRNKGNPAEEHVTFHFVLREDPVSDELKAATIAGMKQRLEAKRQREAKRKVMARRIVAAAAVVLLLLFVTPLGGTVASAAESFFSSVSDWVGSIFRISNSRVDADEEERFKIELTEAMLENDSLYISFKTNNYLLKLSAKGSIYDENGNSIPLYANPCRACDIGSISGEDGSAGHWWAWYRHYGWRMYAPGLRELIQSPEGNYRCQLTVTASYETDDYEPVRSEQKKFDFALENTEQLFKAKRYTIGKKIRKNGAVFHFTELLDSDHSQTLVVEITPDKGTKFHADDGFDATVGLPDARSDEEFECRFVTDGLYRINSQKAVLLMAYSESSMDGEYHGFHEYNKAPYHITVKSVTYNKIKRQTVEKYTSDPDEYGKLPEIYLPIEYNKRGEIETKYENISFPVAKGISIRLNGIRKRHNVKYDFEYAYDERTPDYQLDFTVDQGKLLSVMSVEDGKHVDVMDGKNTTTLSREFPVVFSAMSKGREVFRLRCKMSFGDYGDLKLQNGHYVNSNCKIWLDRPYGAFEDVDSDGNVYEIYKFNIIADNFNEFKNALGDYPSLRAIFRKFDIDTLRLVSMGLYINYYETKDGNSFNGWHKDITLADPTYYDLNRLRKQTGGTYIRTETEEKTAKVNLTLTAKEQQ